MLVKMDASAAGGSNDTAYLKGIYQSANATLNTATKGFPKSVYVVDQDGYAWTNVNPDNGEISDTECWAVITPWTGTWTSMTSGNKFTRSENLVVTNFALRSSAKYMYVVYSTEE